MSLFLMAVVAAATPVPLKPAAPPQAKPAEQCKRTTAQFARRDGKVMAQKLTELPPANLYMGVYRLIDGCEEPIIARYGIGKSDR